MRKTVYRYPIRSSLVIKPIKIYEKRVVQPSAKPINEESVVKIKQ